MPSSLPPDQHTYAPNWSDDLLQQAAGIKLAVFDVDGVLTDGTLSYSGDGENVKHFNVKDGVGIKLLRDHGIEVAVISAKGSAPLDKRMADLGVQHYYPHSHDKWAVLSSLLATLTLSQSQVCYVGDDVIDLRVMRHVGLALCPADAFWLVREQAHVLSSLGGRGVARECADLLLSASLHGSEQTLAELYERAMLPEFEQPTTHAP